MEKVNKQIHAWMTMALLCSLLNYVPNIMLGSWIVWYSLHHHLQEFGWLQKGHWKQPRPCKEKQGLVCRASDCFHYWRANSANKYKSSQVMCKKLEKNNSSSLHNPILLHIETNAPFSTISNRFSKILTNIPIPIVTHATLL